MAIDPHQQKLQTMVRLEALGGTYSGAKQFKDRDPKQINHDSAQAKIIVDTFQRQGERLSPEKQKTGDRLARDYSLGPVGRLKSGFLWGAAKMAGVVSEKAENALSSHRAASVANSAMQKGMQK